MATLTITIPDNLLTRVLLAYGTDNIPSTLVELEANFTAQVKSRLIMIEGEKAKDVKRLEIETANWRKS